MIYISKWKVVAILSTCLMGILFALPNLIDKENRHNFPIWMQNTINLGLELQGGAHIQLEVDTKSMESEHMTDLVAVIRKKLRDNNIGYVNLSYNSSENKITFSLRDLTNLEDVKKAVVEIDPQLVFSIDDDKKVGLAFQTDGLSHLRKEIIDRSIEVIRRRIDETGTKEPLIQSQGDDRIVIQLPGVQDPGEVKERLGRTAKMTIHWVRDSIVNPTSNRMNLPAGTMLLPDSNNQNVLYIVDKKIQLTGESLVNAQANIGDQGPEISLKFNGVGARKFSTMSKSTGKQFAFVMDDKVISAPVFNSHIPDGNGRITGKFTLKEAQETSLLMRAGALPAPLKIIEERTVGPSLGADSIKAGNFATVLAIILVGVFMFLFYSTFGLFANVALVFNVIFLIASLSVLQATLTLPGIAGIALTIGMAVDANVLIFERIREEIQAGLRVAAAINAGYSRAMATIVDSNLTTLIGGLLLFIFGTGPVKGFAVTLSLGIIISMFTAISLTRLITIYWLKITKKTTIPL